MLLFRALNDVSIIDRYASPRSDFNREIFSSCCDRRGSKIELRSFCACFREPDDDDYEEEETGGKLKHVKVVNDFLKIFCSDADGRGCGSRRVV